MAETSSAGLTIPQPVSSRSRVVLASAVGSALEWYDFFIYGTAAALVFNELFFPKLDPRIGTLAAFATFGVGFFARPFGGIVFGHFGDRIGRKPMLVMTLLLVGVATFLIGLIPTYDQIGVWAPVLLVSLRLLQGFGAGAAVGVEGGHGAGVGWGSAGSGRRQGRIRPREFVRRACPAATIPPRSRPPASFFALSGWCRYG